MNAIVRTGYCAFLVSPRNSSAAIAHLLTVTGSDFLLTTPDAATSLVVGGVLDAFKAEGKPILARDMPRFEELLPEKDNEFEPLPPMQTPTMDDVAIILHSSGVFSAYVTYRVLLIFPFAIVRINELSQAHLFDASQPHRMGQRHL